MTPVARYRPPTVTNDNGPPGSTALYRYYDEQDILLYIGITAYRASRERGHAKHSPWMERTVRSTVAQYPTRAEALAAETAAIRAEQPVFNIAENDYPAARERRRGYEAAHPDVFKERPQRSARTVPAQRAVAAPRMPTREEVAWGAEHERRLAVLREQIFMLDPSEHRCRSVGLDDESWQGVIVMRLVQCHFYRDHSDWHEFSDGTRGTRWDDSQAHPLTVLAQS